MSEESFFREVEEELRSDRLRKFWRTYAPFIIGGAVLIVLVVAGNEAWNWWQRTSAARASDQYYAAMSLADDGDVAGAQTALEEIVANGPGGYATLARFRAAGLLAQQGNTDEAIAAYDALASSLQENRLRELALLLGAYTALPNGDVGAIQTRIASIADSDSPLASQAREVIGLAQVNAGEVQEAESTFQALAEDAGSPQVQSRAQLYLDYLASQGVGADDPDPETAVGPEAVLPEDEGAAASEGGMSVETVPADQSAGTPAEGVPAETAPAPDADAENTPDGEAASQPDAPATAEDSAAGDETAPAEPANAQ